MHVCRPMCNAVVNNILVVYRMPAAGKLSVEDSVPAATK